MTNRHEIRARAESALVSWGEPYAASLCKDVALDVLALLDANAALGDQLRETEHRYVTLHQRFGSLAKEYRTRQAEVVALRAALELIKANAEAWGLDSGHPRACLVIAEWCRAALAREEQ